MKNSLKMRIHPWSIIRPFKYPIRFKGYTIDYDSTIGEPCIVCGGQTYRTYEDREWAYCIECKQLLGVYPDY